jgi:hypothetical protein
LAQDHGSTDCQLLTVNARAGAPFQHERQNLEVCLTLDVPEVVTLADGTTARVKAVAASVIDGQLSQVVYTVEKETGAWAEVAREEVQLKES